MYDPASGTWTATGEMISREDFDCCETATLLRDGRVLVTGREGAQLFDPDTMTWTATGKPITRGLGAGAAVLLPDGKVLVAGGGIYPQMLRSAELYDPDTGSWTATGDMNAAHDGPDTATLLRDGTVLVTGRSTSASSSRSAELYDPASGTWTVTGDMISFGLDLPIGNAAARWHRADGRPRVWPRAVRPGHPVVEPILDDAPGARRSAGHAAA